MNTTAALAPLDQALTLAVRLADAHTRSIDDEPVPSYAIAAFHAASLELLGALGLLAVDPARKTPSKRHGGSTWASVLALEFDKLKSAAFRRDIAREVGL